MRFVEEFVRTLDEEIGERLQCANETRQGRFTSFFQKRNSVKEILML
jgi:hypothetical protein